MIRRAPRFLALTILLPGTICGSIAQAQEMFKLLGEKEIRARVVGKNITDSIHWKRMKRLSTRRLRLTKLIDLPPATRTTKNRTASTKS
jgi:hypothetical protein